MFGRRNIGTAICVNGANPVPGTSGWKITEGHEYLLVRRFTGMDGTAWITILADDGSPGNYRAELFSVTENSAETASG